MREWEGDFRECQISRNDVDKNKAKKIPLDQHGIRLSFLTHYEELRRLI